MITQSVGMMEMGIILKLSFLVIFLSHKIYCTELNPEETFSKFYSCYFSKYFSLPLGKVQPQLVSMVDTTVKESLEQDKKVPTKDCIQWICDENLHWKRTRTDNLEIWAYFAEEGNVVDSWEGCYQDELEGFRDSNYSVHEAGEFMDDITTHKLSSRFMLGWLYWHSYTAIATTVLR